MVNWTPAELIAHEAKGAAKRPDYRANFEADGDRERVLHDKIEDYCKRQGWLFVHARMDRATTQALGIPDFIVALPDGITLWVECKRGKQKLTVEQQGIRAWLEKLGHRTVVARSLEDLVRATKDGLSDAIIAAGREG